MRRVDSAIGKHYYSHRMSVVEPVFANIGTNKRLNRFTLRSKKKVQGQWHLYCLVHNIEKLMRYGAVSKIHRDIHTLRSVRRTMGHYVKGFGGNLDSETGGK